MTLLEQRLIGLIEANGPISLAEYMAVCLYDPKHGYYRSREPFGRGGDFVTAPEISQMFGELIAVWILTAWEKSGSPERVAFAEIGPGRGILMKDMIRTLKSIAPEFMTNAKIFMIETSPRLAAMQRRTLGPSTSRIEWIDTLEELPPLPLFLVGNEIFDALPVRQFIRCGALWLERMIIIGEDGKLAFGAGPASLESTILPCNAGQQRDGTVFEIAPSREALAGSVSDHLAKHGGGALFFDYGHADSGFGDTFQAIGNHKYEDPLHRPGEADLTSHVDFSALSKACSKPGIATGLMEQGQFLLSMGLAERAGRLAAGADADMRRQIEADADRLSAPGEMGKMFKAMTIFFGDHPPFPF